MAWWRLPSKRGARKARARPTIFWITCWRQQDPETGHRMNPQDLIHNMQFFIVAGHETTALAISWALYLLANTPEYQARARREAQAQLQGRAACAGDLGAMPFVKQVLEEAMRLYPPVGLLARTVVEKDELCGRMMRPGDTLFLPIWALHRHQLWWERPDEFDPDRFDPVTGPRRDKYQYLPFGAGPRVCVGANFAMMQAQIILATLVARFKIRPSPARPASGDDHDGAARSGRFCRTGRGRLGRFVRLLALSLRGFLFFLGHLQLACQIFRRARHGALVDTGGIVGALLFLAAHTLIIASELGLYAEFAMRPAQPESIRPAARIPSPLRMPRNALSMALKNPMPGARAAPGTFTAYASRNLDRHRLMR